MLSRANQLTVGLVNSEVSSLSDSAYTSNFGETAGRRVSMELKKMQQQSENASDNHGTLIRDILQAFADVVSAQGPSKVPVHIPTRDLPRGETHVPGNDQSVGDGIFSV